VFGVCRAITNNSMDRRAVRVNLMSCCSMFVQVPGTSTVPMLKENNVKVKEIKVLKLKVKEINVKRKNQDAHGLTPKEMRTD
jgi:hypothetical protein